MRGKAADTITDEIFRQIMEVRSGGRVNMLDITAVQREAYEHEFFDLVNYIEEYRKDYFMFILHGKREQ